MNLGSTPSLPAPAGGSFTSSRGKGLSRRAKAAIVVRYLIDRGADIALEDLPDELQAVLTHQMGALRLVDKDTVQQVVDEFAAELERVGMHFPGGIAGALQMLDGKISPHTAKRLRREAGVRQMGNPWERIRGLPAEKLAPIFEEETPEICAVILSNLEVAAAAEILGMLPGPRARQITYAVSQTGGVSPDAVDRIGLSIAAQMESEPVLAFEDGPVERVGAILNKSTTATREDVLSGLEETDKAFADEVRKSIFTFANIPVRVAPRDLPTVLRAADQGQLVIALKAAEQMGMEDVQEFVFSNMSARLADQMKEEIGELEDVKTADAEAAMAAIVTTIRDLEATGELTLLQIEEAEEE